jgi:hypothetical protein
MAAMYQQVCCCDVISFMLSSPHHDQYMHQRKVHGRNDDECCLRRCYKHLEKQRGG